MVTTSCAAQPPNLMWWERSQERVTRALLLGAGSPPMRERLWAYCLFEGSGKDGQWAYLSPHTLLGLPEKLQARLGHYEPRVEAESGLQLVVQSAGSATWKSVDHVSPGDSVYAEAFDETFKLVDKE